MGLNHGRCKKGSYLQCRDEVDLKGSLKRQQKNKKEEDIWEDINMCYRNEDIPGRYTGTDHSEMTRQASLDAMAPVIKSYE